MPSFLTMHATVVLPLYVAVVMCTELMSLDLTVAVFFLKAKWRTMIDGLNCSYNIGLIRLLRISLPQFRG